MLKKKKREFYISEKFNSIASLAEFLEMAPRKILDILQEQTANFVFKTFFVIVDQFFNFFQNL